MFFLIEFESPLEIELEKLLTCSCADPLLLMCGKNIWIIWYFCIWYEIYSLFRYLLKSENWKILENIFIDYKSTSLCSGRLIGYLRQRYKTSSRPLTFTKAVTEFLEPYRFTPNTTQWVLFEFVKLKCLKVQST
jgi:hypothetical protein